MLSVVIVISREFCSLSVICNKGYHIKIHLLGTWMQNVTMDSMGMIIFGIVMLHLIVGFGYILYKLNGKKDLNLDS